jgi:hypothetical protein
VDDHQFGYITKLKKNTAGEGAILSTLHKAAYSVPGEILPLGNQKGGGVTCKKEFFENMTQIAKCNF